MTCNCGGNNEYDITVNNNGDCEPSTPIYNITLGNVGINGYSPIVNFINVTDESFNLQVENITGVTTSGAIPLYDWVSGELDNINTTLSNIHPEDYMQKDGSNAQDTVLFNHLTFINNNNTKQQIKTNNGTELKVSGQGLELDGGANSSIAYPNKIVIASTGSSITIGNTNEANIVVTNTSATYNGNEIATLADVPTVGNGTIGIMMNGAIKGSFKVNQSHNTILDLGSTSNYTAGNGIDITSNVISVDESDLDFLKNTATGTSSLTILGNSSDEPYTINIGNGSYANYAGSVVVGYNALSNGYDNIAIGNGAKCKYGDNNIAIGANAYVGDDTISVDNGYQIGTGTNLTSNSLAVGYEDSIGDTHNYQLLDLTTGKIPNDRINIMGGATTLTGGSAGLVPAPTTSDIGKYLNGNGTWTKVSGSSITNPINLITDSNDMFWMGISENVTPHKIYGGCQNSNGVQYLKFIYDSSNPISLTDDPLGHGTSKIELNYNTNTMGLDSSNKLTVKEMTGCDSITGGTSGLVPAPSAGDENKFLKADGTWDTVGGGGGGTSYVAGTGININNDTISTSSTVVTTDTAQTITGGKVFNNNIDIIYGNHIRSIYNGTPSNILLNSYEAISLGNTSSALSFIGVGDRPRYTKNLVDYSDLALVSDVPTVNNPTITFTQGGTTKGTITLNQSSNATIALDAGGAGSGGTEIYEDSQASEYLPSVIVGDGLTLDYSVIYTDWTNPQMNSASQDGYVVTSNYNSSESGADNWKAFDKDTTTSENCWWSGAYPNTPVWIQLEVPTAVIPTSCTIYNEVATPANFKDAVLQGSNDGTNYDDLYTITNSPNTAGYSQTYNITTNTTYKYLRLSCTSYWDVGVSLQEIIWEGKIPSGLSSTPSLKVELAIDDTTASNSTVYSSQKTQDLIDALVARITALENNIDGGNA